MNKLTLKLITGNLNYFFPDNFFKESLCGGYRTNIFNVALISMYFSL